MDKKLNTWVKIPALVLATFVVIMASQDAFAESEENDYIIIHILNGSSSPAPVSYIGASQSLVNGYYSMDRIIVDPGTTIIWINNDDVSHSISSGSGLTRESRASQGTINICDGDESLREGASYRITDCTFTTDNRVSSGEILPGKSWSVTIEDAGFYRLVDVDYIWMTSTIYAFPNVDSLIIRGNPENLN